MATQPQYIGTVKTPAASFVNADGLNFKTILAAGSSGSRIDTLSVSNTDTTNAYVLQLAIQLSGVDYILGEVAIPIGSGTNGSAKSVAALNSTDIPALAYTENGSLYLASGAILRGRLKTTAAGSNTVQVTGVAGDY
jgi:hypothetical protein